mgnify:CR=1 FL=1
MRILLAMVVLVSIAISASAATEPGTIITTSASMAYRDSTSQQMHSSTSNTENVLVVPNNPDPVFMAVRSLYIGPSTVGRNVKLAGRIFKDTDGQYWLDDGSVLSEKDATGKSYLQKLYCKVSSVFVTESQLAACTDCTVVTGISQTEADGTPIIIPADDASLQSLQQ